MGLIAWLPLHETSIKNKGSNNQTFSQSNTSLVTSGKTGKCLSFNGSNSYVYGNIELTENMTFACWIKFGASSTYHIIDCRASSGETGYQPMYGGYGYGLQCHSSNGGSYTWDNNVCGFTSGVWYHLLVTITPSNATLYINGISKGTQSGTFGYAFGSREMRIGTRCSGANWLNGQVNDVRVYDHVLSETEIKNLSRALVLHYNFEDLYTPLDYIEATGTQWIQTDLLSSNFSSKKIRCEIGIMPTSGSSARAYSTWIGCQQNLQYLLRSDYGKLCTYAGGNINYPITMVDNTMYDMSFTADYNNNVINMVINGTNYNYTGTSWGSNATGIMLFASHAGGPPWTSELGVGKLYYCRFYNGDTLIRDFIPAKRNIDGKVGLFDKVNGTFYTNAGTGDFYYEGCFEPVNYQNASISKNTVTFSKSSDGWGNSGILAKKSFSKGYVAATVAQNNRYIMIGMASVNNSYNYTQGYFIYPSNNGHYHIYEMGNHIGDMGTYAANDRFHVVYDGAKISYYINTTLVREVGVSGKMYMNITNYNAASATIKDVCYGSLEMVEDVSGNEHYARLQNSNAFSQTSDSRIGEYALRNVSGDSNARINTTLNPSFISNGTICFWYKKDSSAFGYNSGHFLVATQSYSGYFFGATAAGLPFNSGCSYGTFYLDGVSASDSNVQDTNWHFYAFTGVNLTQWTSFSMQAHGDASWLWRGNIADFKIYNTSLSASDIKDLYETRMIIDNKGNIYCEKLIDKQSSCEFPNNQGLIKATDFMVSNEAQINGEYDLLEYIESTGTQYIDTGVKQTNKGCIDCKFHNVTTSADYWFGSRQSSSYFMLYNGFYNNAILEYNWLTINYTSSPFVEMKQRIEGNDIIISINGVQTRVATGTADNNNIFIFACNNASIRYYAGKLRLYYFKMYDNNVLIRDYIPVRRKSDGVIGLFDKVDGILYTNKGSGTFGVGTSKGTCYMVGGKNIYEGMGASVNAKIQKIGVPSIQIYTLSISNATGISLTVNRTSSSYGSTGVLSHGATLYEGDILTISASANSGYTLSSLKVNDSSFSSGSTHTVSGNVSVATTSAVAVGWKTIATDVTMEFQDIMTGIQGMGPVYSQLFTTADEAFLNAMNTYTADKIRITGTAEFEEINDPTSGSISTLQTVSQNISNMLLSNGSVSSSHQNSNIGFSYTASITLKGYTTVNDYSGNAHKGVSTSTTQTSHEFKPMGTSVGTFTYKFTRFRITKVEAYY